MSDMPEVITLPDGRKFIEWPEIIEFVRTQHNGVMRIDLYFGHDGDNVCTFGRYHPDPPFASASSGGSMQEAVERCYYEWYLANRSQISTNSGWEEFTATLGIELDANSSSTAST